ncbi:IS110 family transposase [Leptospirillum ferriphilum]|uniref:IS110 family transposase n=1 Tax=Leptospirillum ferriphilum TaxID=178606 RepID=UPI0006B20FF7|nr:IS110 family transposase [Leptospirillum ferriphilum]
MKVTTLGIDIAKSLFTLHGVDEKGRVVLQKTVTRARLVETVAKFSPCTIGMEACGGAHHWAREFEKIGHTVKLMHAKYVKAYVKTHKNDGRDAEAICEAVTRPNMRFVPVKTIAQQELSALLSMRALLVKQQTGLINHIRGLMAELGIVFPKGVKKAVLGLVRLLDPENSALSPFSKGLFQTLSDQLAEIGKRIALLNEQILRIHRNHPICQRLSRIPGIGPVTAVALVATLPGITFFENSRHLSAWLGLVPNQHSSGGKPRLGRISKRGDRSLRTLLIHGARSVVRLADRRTDPLGKWICRLKNERGANKAAVALANKTARIVWALLARDQEYKKLA